VHEPERRARATECKDAQMIWNGKQVADGNFPHGTLGIELAQSVDKGAQQGERDRRACYRERRRASVFARPGGGRASSRALAVG